MSHLIILNGFAGAGKSTVAGLYKADHPLALVVEGDELIVNLGQWLTHEPEAREIVYAMTKNLAEGHLARGYDVVLPYLVTNASHVAAFEQIAQAHEAQFFNFFLHNQKDTAIARLLERGTWGEAGLDPLGEKDTPEIYALYDRMEAQLERQHGIITIDQEGRGADETYQTILDEIHQSKQS